MAAPRDQGAAAAPGRVAALHLADARSAELGSVAAALADAWAVRSQDDVRAQGRRVAGGWPGTLSEARVVAKAYFASRAGASLCPVSREELEQVSRAANARARAAWRAVASSDEPETTEEVPR